MKIPDSFELIQDEKGLSLKDLKNPKFQNLKIDFNSPALNFRRKHGGSESLIKAIGVNKKVLDATTGLGRDSFILACFGCEVLMLERNKIIFSLLRDGLKRAGQIDETKDIVSRMKLKNCDAIEYLKKCKESFDVIYLDPMFPESKKSRLVKKEMRIFKELVGDDSDADKLLKLALKKAKKVVVKRHSDAEFLGAVKPDYQIGGRSNRFDIYIT